MHKILKITFRDELYKDVLNLRYEVLREPLGLTIRDSEIEHDRNVLYFAYVVEEKILGVVGLDLSSTAVAKIIQMAVRENTQGLGVGRQLINALEEEAKAQGFAEIVLDARLNAQGFYNRLGYKEYGGVYEKIGIPHILMQKELI